MQTYKISTHKLKNKWEAIEKKGFHVFFVPFFFFFGLVNKYQLFLNEILPNIFNLLKF